MRKDYCIVQYILFFTEFPSAFGLLESVFRAIVNSSRVYPPLAGLPAVFLVRHFCGGLESWRADHLMAASLTGGGIHGLTMTPIHKLLEKQCPLFPIKRVKH
jgi:hypothetical protein